ncbi:MAG: ATP-binding protein [bacterium]|nr:ATP-binding protein [bacterium]MCM1424300.1 ATP-binding protein [bacterium]
MLRRKSYEKLAAWKRDPEKKALCITGARQIGKTTLIREFGRKEYAHFAEINFVADEKAAEIFDDGLTAEDIITNLTAYVRRPLTPGNTLILLDEIQECPRARAAIKFLVEDGRFDYIESGSLLGVRFREVKSYPVGFEEIYRMYPLDFEEFLWANGVQEKTIRYLKKCYYEEEQVSDAVHDTLLRLFYSYMIVGGMPENVQIYVNTQDIAKVVRNQRSILDLYRLDIAKYAVGSEREKAKAIFDSIPSQLNEKNRRFILTALDPNGRQQRYEDSFNWLADAGAALPCYNVREPQPPLQLNEKRNLFKLFMNDTGLLCAACMENIQFAILKGELGVNMGSILENMAAQQLTANGFALHYYDSKKTGEIDFVVQRGMSVDLVECKSGSDYKKHPALNRMSAVENWTFANRMVFCRGNVERVGEILYLPWYLIMFYRMDEFPEQLIYQVDLSGL